MPRTSTIKALIASLLLAMPAVQAATITFDEPGPGFVHGSVVNTQYNGVTISAVNNDSASSSVPNLAVAFDSDTLANATSDDDLLAPFTNSSGLGNANPDNILIIQENNSGCVDGVCDNPDDEGSRNAGETTPGAGFLLFEFDNPIELISLDFFDIENVSGNDENSGINGSEIRFLDGSGVEMFAHQYVPGTGGDNTWDRLMFAGITGIRGLEVNLYGSGAIDNLVYNVVPIPSAVWLFGTALLGFIGFSRRTSI